MLIDTAAILAGGLATRLRPMTQTIPKSMLPIAGEPFLSHQLKLLKRKGIQNVVLCVGYLGEQLEDYAGDGSRWGVRIHYSYDGDRILGTGGALRKALTLLPEQFFVLYGDSYLDIDYEAVAEAYEKGNKPGLMTVYRNQGKYDASNVVFQNGEVVRYDKERRTEDMEYIDYGLGILTGEVVGRLAEGERRDLAELYRQLVGQGLLSGFEVQERFYEVGSLEGIRALEQRLSAMEDVGKGEEEGT